MHKLLLGVAGMMLISSPAFASCYGTGYNRYCDGIGGPGATYSPRGNSGSTTYYNNGSPSRTQTYTTTPNYGGGYTRQQNTIYYNR